VEGLCSRCLSSLALGFAAPKVNLPEAAPSSQTKEGSLGSIQLDDYELLEQIGSGGMGIVYRARQRSLNRIAAVKTIRSGQLAGARVIQRFRLEAEAAACLQHPNIVQVYEVGEADGLHFYSMEYVSGRSLAEMIRERPLPVEEAARMMGEIARAMASAHKNGIIHRDLKPSNVLIDENGAARITDFGIAKFLELDCGQTVTGEILGSVSYMPPEQAGGHGLEVDARADIYSMGAILYELLSGRPPFHAAQPVEILRQVLEMDPAPPRLMNPATPPDLETICLKCLAKEPSRRYQTAEELGEDLQRFLEDKPIQARPATRRERAWRWCRRNPLVAGLGALAAVSLLALAVGSSLAAIHLARVSRAAIANEIEARKHLGEAIQARAAEEAQRLEAETSERRARDLNYFANMAAARHAWDRNDFNGLRLRLEETADYPGRGFEWYWWQRQLRQGSRTFTGHHGAVLGVTFSPDGSHLLTGGADGLIKVWDPATGKELRSIQANPNGVAHLAFSPDGRRFVTTGRAVIREDIWRDPIRRVWDVADWSELLAVDKGEAHSDEWEARGGAVVTPDGERVVTMRHAGSAGRELQVWRLEDGTDLQKAGFEIWASRSGGFSRDGRLVFIGSQGGDIEIWNSELMHQVHTFSISPDFARGTADFSPDGQEVAFGDSSGAVRIWSLETGVERLKLSGHAGPVQMAAYSPDGLRLATTGEDLTVRLWSVADGRQLEILRGHSGAVISMAFSPDGSGLATASADRTAKLWEFEQGAGILSLSMLPDVQHSYRLARHAERLLVMGLDNTARVIDTASGQELSRFEHAGWVFAGAISPDGTVVMSATWDLTPRIWEAATGREITRLIGHTSHCQSGAFAPDQRRIVTGAQDRFARVWEVESGRLLLTSGIHEGWVLGVAFSPDGQRFASVDEGASVRVWNSATGELIYRRDGGSFPVAFSPDGRWLITGGEGNTVQIREAASGEVRVTLRGHTARIQDVDFFPNERRIITGSRDRTARIWDMESGRELLALTETGGTVDAVDCSEDGRRVVTVASGYPAPQGNRQGGTVRMWEAATPEEVEAWHRVEQEAARRQAEFNADLQMP
jgi:eukaryotic-like serine/threonine-protein kinase